MVRLYICIATVLSVANSHLAKGAGQWTVFVFVCLFWVSIKVPGSVSVEQ